MATVNWSQSCTSDYENDQKSATDLIIRSVTTPDIERVRGHRVSTTEPVAGLPQISTAALKRKSRSVRRGQRRGAAFSRFTRGSLTHWPFIGARAVSP